MLSLINDATEQPPLGSTPSDTAALNRQRSTALDVLEALIELTPGAHPQSVRRTVTILASITSSASSGHATQSLITRSLDLLERVMAGAWTPAYTDVSTGVQVVTQRQLLPSALGAGLEVLGNVAEAQLALGAKAGGYGARVGAAMRTVLSAGLGAAIPGQAATVVTTPVLSVRAQRLATSQLGKSGAGQEPMVAGRSSVALPSGLAQEPAFVEVGWVDLHLVDWQVNQHSNSTSRGLAIDTTVLSAEFINSGMCMSCCTADCAVPSRACPPPPRQMDERWPCQAL